MVHRTCRTHGKVLGHQTTNRRCHHSAPPTSFNHIFSYGWPVSRVRDAQDSRVVIGYFAGAGKVIGWVGTCAGLCSLAGRTQTNNWTLVRTFELAEYLYVCRYKYKNTHTGHVCLMYSMYIWVDLYLHCIYVSMHVCDDVCSRQLYLSHLSLWMSLSIDWLRPFFQNYTTERIKVSVTCFLFCL